MHLGERIRLTLFGTSHGPRVGALLNGVPAGIEIDSDAIELAMASRRPGGRYASKRREPDVVEFRSGVADGKTTGEEIEISIANKDAKSRDYSFLPAHPRPGHQDMVMHKRTNGDADLRGGGSSSARLTAALVASAALLSPLLNRLKVVCEAHVGAIGQVEAKEMSQCRCVCFRLANTRAFQHRNDMQQLRLSRPRISTLTRVRLVAYEKVRTTRINQQTIKITMQCAQVHVKFLPVQHPRHKIILKRQITVQVGHFNKDARKVLFL